MANLSHARWVNSGKMRVINRVNFVDTDLGWFTASPELSHGARQPHTSRPTMHSSDDSMVSRFPSLRPNGLHVRLDVCALRALVPAS